MTVKEREREGRNEPGQIPLQAERERLQQEILDRMIVSFRASKSRHTDSPHNPWVEQRVSVMTAMATLFLGFPIPMWPPGLLIRKIVRRLVLPLFSPQVEFNKATRDVLLDMRQRNEAQAAALQENRETISRIEEQVEALTAELESMRRERNSRGEAVTPQRMMPSIKR